LVWLIICLNKI